MVVLVVVGRYWNHLHPNLHPDHLHTFDKEHNVFILREYLRQALSERPGESYHRVVEDVIRELPQEQLLQAAIQGAKVVANSIVTYDKVSQGKGKKSSRSRPDTGTSKKVTAKKKLLDRVEYSPRTGEEIPVREFSVDDCKAKSVDLDLRAQSLFKKASNWALIAEYLETHAYTTIGDAVEGGEGLGDVEELLTKALGDDETNDEEETD